MNKKKIMQIQQEIDYKNKAISKETTVFQVDREPDFVKLYIKDVCAINDLKKNAYQVLIECLNYLDYDGEITLLAYHRNKIAKKIGVTDRTVKNQLALLTQKKVFKRKSNNVYVANPDLFGKGSWSHVEKMKDEYKLIIEYKGKKRVIKGSPNLKFVESAK